MVVPVFVVWSTVVGVAAWEITELILTEPTEKNDTVSGPPPPPLTTEIDPPDITTQNGGDTYNINLPAGDLPPIEVPRSRMPIEADNQKDLDTPRGRSIAISKSIKDQKLGGLLYKPISKQKLTVVDYSSPTKKNDFIKAQESGEKNFREFLTGRNEKGELLKEQPNIQKLSALLLPSKIRGFSGEYGLTFGPESLAVLNRDFTSRSLTAYTPIITKGYKEYTKQSKAPKETFNFKQGKRDNKFSLGLSRVGLMYQLLGLDILLEKGDTEYVIDTLMERVGNALFLKKEDKKAGIIGEEKLIYEPNDFKYDNLIDLLLGSFASLFWKLGLQHIPSELPESLLSFDDDSYKDETEGVKIVSGKDKKDLPKINSFLKVFEWYIVQFDALVGEFPITIDIKDADPTKKGEQTKKIELANISETLAECYRLSREAAVEGDVIVNFMMRLVPEILSVKNATLISQDYIKAMNDYLGYPGNPKNRKVKYNFNMFNFQTIDELLQEKEGTIVGWESKEKNSVAEYLRNLMFAAAIIKAVFLRQDDKDFKGLTEKFGIKDREKDNDLWKQFKQDLEDKDSDYNKGQTAIPKIKTDKLYKEKKTT